MKEILEARLAELDITPYELAKRVAEKRGRKKATDVSTTVNSVLKSPERRRYETLAEIIKVMGGDIVIRWHSVEEKVVS